MITSKTRADSYGVKRHPVWQATFSNAFTLFLVVRGRYDSKQLLEAPPHELNEAKKFAEDMADLALVASIAPKEPRP